MKRIVGTILFGVVTLAGCSSGEVAAPSTATATVTDTVVSTKVATTTARPSTSRVLVTSTATATITEVVSSTAVLTETIQETVQAAAAAPAASAASISNGTYLVGVDIEPGNWRCSSQDVLGWRTTDQSNGLIDVGVNGLAHVPADAFAVELIDCSGEWQKVG